MRYAFEIVTLQAQPTVAMEATVAPVEMAPMLARMWPRVAAEIAARGVEPAGRPYLKYLGVGATMHIEAGIAVAQPLDVTGELLARELPGGRAATTVHMGPYAGVEDAWTQMYAWLQQQGHAPSLGGWDVYETDPQTVTDPGQLRTLLFQPLG